MPGKSRASLLFSPITTSNNRIANRYKIDVICLYLHKVKASGRWPVPPRFRLALFLQGKAIDEATTKPESGTLRPKKRNVSLDIFDERQLRKSSRKITEKQEI